MTKEEKNTLKELTLLTLYLGGWEEDSRRDPGKKVFRAWKGFLFEILSELEQDGNIRSFTKSVVFTEEGRTKAERLKQVFNAPGLVLEGEEL